MAKTILQCSGLYKFLIITIIIIINIMIIKINDLYCIQPPEMFQLHFRGVVMGSMSNTVSGVNSCKYFLTYIDLCIDFHIHYLPTLKSTVG